MSQTVSRDEEILSSEKKLWVFLSFFNGYVFRQTIEFLKATLTVAPIYVYKDHIRITRSNGLNSLINDVYFRANDILEYYVDEEQLKLQPGNCFVINVDLKNLHDNLKKAITKNQSLSLCLYEGDNFLYLGSSGSIKSTNGHISMVLEPFEEKEYNIVSAENEILKPNTKIPMPQFVASWQAAAQAKNSTTTIKCYAHGLQLISPLATGASKLNPFWGEIEPDEEPIYSGNVSLSIIKALGKIAGFSKLGLVKVYCLSSGYLKFECSLEDTGFIQIIFLNQ